VHGCVHERERGEGDNVENRIADATHKHACAKGAYGCTNFSRDICICIYISFAGHHQSQSSCVESTSGCRTSVS